MNRALYLLIVLYVIVFAAESVIAGRWRPRIAYADTWVTAILVMLSIALLVLSLWRKEDVAGKIGVAVVIAGWILQSILFRYFNS